MVNFTDDCLGETNEFTYIIKDTVGPQLSSPYLTVGPQLSSLYLTALWGIQACFISPKIWGNSTSRH